MTRLWRPRSVRTRLVASTVLVTFLLTLVVGVVLHRVLDRTVGRDVDQVLRSRADAMVTVVVTASADTPGRLTVPDGALTAGVWVVDAAGRTVAGAVEPQARATAAALATVRAPVQQGAGDDTRVRAQPFVTRDGVRGVVLVSQDTGPYERSETYATLTIVVLGAFAMAVAGGVAWLVSGRALAPVRVMAARASEWSEHDLGHRFALGEGDDELTTLGRTLDRLLDRVAQAIRAEQRLTSELAHELRTPLTGIRGVAELALLRGVDDPALRADLEDVARSAAAMADVITALLDLARDGRAEAGRGCALEDLLARVAEHVPPGTALAVGPLPSDARIAAPLEMALAALSPVVENAGRHAASSVRLEATETDGALRVRVADDGAGIDPALGARIFESGFSGADGTGLGLGIARRVARSLGGDVETAPGDGAGAAFVVRLPLLS
ncbi:HAMP domain-containing histidine kinase [Nocardioides sp. TRM66260-LWL]|uniref:HAMP domain-containing sensor histidine kinase n=1 Tax=Nocardioides sp. TRM66260-LWL TaxID=2874478 RepID=UPI001CC3C1BB|nr:HAMP domain-containing sensor histidine kinase [Nocardioides sp. TRM66260-LWL]MBZ5735933.1 HAMP domain-containing histidine kinase [Nocardioides sp. TRM66260-LWL]